MGICISIETSVEGRDGRVQVFLHLDSGQQGTIEYVHWLDKTSEGKQGIGSTMKRGGQEAHEQKTGGSLAKQCN